MIRFIFLALFVVLFLICSIPLLIIEYFIGKFNMDVKNRSSLAIVNWAFKGCLFIAGTTLTVIGEENVPKDQPVLYVGNHRSYFDIVITYIRVPRPTGYIAKKEMLRYPLLRNWMKYLHCTFIDRSDIKQGMKTILENIDKIKSGISVCVFPEGTRNKTEKTFLPFHAGSFKIAEKAGCPIVPITLNNTGAIFENHIPFVRKAHIVLEYGKPLYVNEMTSAEKKNVSKTVQEIIRETYFRNEKLVTVPPQSHS